MNTGSNTTDTTINVKSSCYNSIWAIFNYPHPDKTYYNIDPSHDWITVGDRLIHYQINANASNAIMTKITQESELFFTVLGLAIVIGTLGTYGLVALIGELFDRGC